MQKRMLNAASLKRFERSPAGGIEGEACPASNGPIFNKIRDFGIFWLGDVQGDDGRIWVESPEKWCEEWKLPGNKIFCCSFQMVLPACALPVW